MIIAVTGYIGSGKSTVSQILNKQGYSLIEADIIGHELLMREDIAEKVRAEFGIRVLNRKLKVDRNKLAKVVFSDSDMLRKLNEIMHPPLMKEIHDKVFGIGGKVVIDVALYVELQIEVLAQKSILIATDLDVIYNRLNPDYTKEEILNVMNSQ